MEEVHFVRIHELQEKRDSQKLSQSFDDLQSPPQQMSGI